MLLASTTAAAQLVLDRVIARVNGEPITLSDARAAITLGIVETPSDADPVLAARRQLIERRLVLSEVARFAPPEPGRELLAQEVTALKARVGGAAQLDALERATGVGDAQIREIARDSLRIDAYLNQRFGAAAQPTDDDVGQYYRTHLDEFRDGDRIMPFAEAEPLARRRAAEARRRGIIDQWLRELRQRADVVELYPR